MKALMGFVVALLMALPASAQLVPYSWEQVTVSGGVVEFRDRTTLQLLNTCNLPTINAFADEVEFSVCSFEGSQAYFQTLPALNAVLVRVIVDEDHAVYSGENGFGVGARVEYKTERDVLGVDTACFSGHGSALPTFPPQEPPYEMRAYWSTSNAGAFDQIGSYLNLQEVGEGGNPLAIASEFENNFNLNTGLPDRTAPNSYLLYTQDFSQVRIDGPLPAAPWCRWTYGVRFQAGHGSSATGNSSVSAIIWMQGLAGPQPHMN